ncbi:hypothetical protein RUND412_000193 [Rhizina undulata]
MPSIEDLPFEILSEILSIAAEFNSQDAITYTYGLTQALQRQSIQKYLRGRTPPDTLRWNLVDSFRQVNSRWHEWALSYSLKELYVRRWRGGETWLNGKETFEERKGNATDIYPVVYQDPFKSVKSTAKLFTQFPSIASHVRRIWFNGIYQFETNKYVFQVLQNCVNLRTAAVPWSTMRYGSEEEWEALTSFPRLTSLEFLAVSLKNQQITAERNLIDTQALATSKSLNFGGLRRMKLFGESNMMPVTDEDLFNIARTATNLEEILITGATSITIKGIAALVSSSRRTLKLLEYTPLSDEGFRHPSAARDPQVHICALLASCPRLTDLAITVPTCCKDLFKGPTNWHETVRVRIAGGGSCSVPEQSLAENIEEFVGVLNSAREMVERRKSEGVSIDIEIAIGNYLFDTKTQLVHGNYKNAKKLSEMAWSPVEHLSRKGPYGHTGLYGDEVKGEWSCISEADFFDAMRWGLVKFEP